MESVVDPLSTTCNADKFGIFYQALPTKVMELIAKRCFGGKSKNYVSSFYFILNLQVSF